MSLLTKGRALIGQVLEGVRPRLGAHALMAVEELLVGGWRDRLARKMAPEHTTRKDPYMMVYNLVALVPLSRVQAAAGEVARTRQSNQMRRSILQPPRPSSRRTNSASKSPSMRSATMSACTGGERFAMATPGFKSKDT